MKITLSLLFWLILIWFSYWERQFTTWSDSLVDANDPLDDTRVGSPTLILKWCADQTKKYYFKNNVYETIMNSRLRKMGKGAN